MSTAPEGNQQKKKLLLLVGVIMLVIFCLWLFVLYPVTARKASESADFEAQFLFSNLDEARKQAQDQYDQYRDSQENTLEPVAPEERKETVEVPRLPDSDEVIKEHNSEEKEEEN
jgi:hypothetical protein